MSTIIDRILSEVCLDERIPDGIFDMSNNSHMDALRESLTDNHGLALNDVKTIHNKMVEGKYPERQAYNKDGLLVTFPTPQHKARAIQRGTHFEQDPSKGPQNVFGGGQQPPGAQQPPQAQTPQGQPIPAAQEPAPAPAPEAPKAEPAAQSAPSQLPASDAPAASAAPAAQSTPSSLPTSSVPAAPPTTGAAQSDKQGLSVEPTATPGTGEEAPAPPPNFDTPKSPQQRAAEANAVKQIMHGDDTNPSLLPSITERRYIELNRTLNFAKQMGYKEAVIVISEAMNNQ